VIDDVFSLEPKSEETVRNFANTSTKLGNNVLNIAGK